MRTQDITSISRHREHLREHLDQVKETGRPMFITNRGGDTEAVVISANQYDSLMEELEAARSLMMIEKSMSEIKAGRVKDAKQSLREMAKNLGLEMNR